MMNTRKLVEGAAKKICDNVDSAMQRNVDGLVLAHALDGDCAGLIEACGSDYKLTDEVCNYYLTIRKGVMEYADAQAQYQVTKGATLH